MIRGITICWLAAYIAIAAMASAQNGPNLIVNPGADAGAGAPTGYETVVVPGWAPTGAFTAVPWSIGGGFPVLASPGPSDRGANFFSGGSTQLVSTGSQVAGASAYAVLIDAGAAAFEVSGWFGGFASQEDRASLTATFRSGAGAVLGSVTIGDVTATERGLLTGLLYRVSSGVLPIGTRSIEFLITMMRFAGTYNDGYADSLSFRLASTATATVLGSGCGGAPIALATSAPLLGLSFSIGIAGGAASAAGELLVSPPSAAASPIGGGCFAYLDLSAFFALTPYALSPGGAWGVTLGLPADAGLAGLQVVMQAYAVPGTGPFGIDITNGVLLQLGF